MIDYPTIKYFYLLFVCHRSIKEAIEKQLEIWPVDKDIRDLLRVTQEDVEYLNNYYTTIKGYCVGE